MAYKRILLFGTGAIGGYFGGRLAIADFPVEFIARGERLEAIKNHGLTLKSTEGAEETISVKADAKPSGQYDLILIAVKSQDTSSAAEACKDHLYEGGVVLSLQNGVDNLDKLAFVFGEDTIMGAVINSGIFAKDNTITYKPAVKLTIGALTAKLKTHEPLLSEMFNRAGINCVITDDIKQAQWQKLLWNMAFNPLSALTNATCGELADNEYAMEIMQSIVAETIGAAERNGIHLPDDVGEKALLVRESFRDYKTSALQDVERNRVPEISMMEAVISESAPVSRTVYNLSKFIFGRWFHSFPRLAADVIAINSQKEVLLIERKYPPYGWAIPGGMAELGETIETTAVRELMEETNITAKDTDLHLLGVYSDPSRDSRGHTISVIYYLFTDQQAVAADDAKNVEWHALDNLPDMVFDHNKVLKDLIKRL